MASQRTHFHGLAVASQDAPRFISLDGCEIGIAGTSHTCHLVASHERRYDEFPERKRRCVALGVVLPQSRGRSRDGRQELLAGCCGNGAGGRGACFGAARFCPGGGAGAGFGGSVGAAVTMVVSGILQSVSQMS